MVVCPRFSTRRDEHERPAALSGGGSHRGLRRGAAHAPRGAEGDRRHHGRGARCADARGAGASRACRQGPRGPGAPGRARRPFDCRGNRRISRRRRPARRIPRAARSVGPFSRRARVPREPRPHAPYRGRHAARRESRLRGARRGPALARRRDRQARLRRHSRHPRQGGSRAPRAGFQERPRVRGIAAFGARRPRGHGRFLLRRRSDLARRGGGARPAGRRAFLRRSGAGAGRAWDRRGGARDLRRARQPHQPEHPGHRGGDGQARQNLPQDHLPERGPRFPQRYRRALRRRCGEGRVGRDARVVRQIPRVEKIHDVRRQAEGWNMALWDGCKGFACGHASCGGAAPRDAVDFGRRDFLIDALAATAGLTGLGGCASPVMQASNPADTILVNGRIATLAPRSPAASALAIRGGNIAAIGAAAEIEGLRGPDTRVIDAGGRTVIPGLNDGHTHFIRGGLTYTNEVRWDGVPSLAEGLRRVREQAQRTPAPHWVQVIGGWTWAQFAEQRHPTLEEINAATGDTPCMIMHLYDRAWLNRAGIRALGWTKETPNMFGGAIERDASGNPTGLVMSTTSLASLVSVWLRIPRLSPEDQILSTRHFMREHNRLGVTSVIDAGGGGQNYPENYAAIAKLAADEQMTLRIGYMLYAAGDVANFAKDYPVPPAGVLEKNLSAVVKYIVEQGWPFRQHTSFDASASRVLDVLEQVNREIPLKNLRWGLDHCEALQSKTLERIAALGGSIDIQNRMSLDGEAFLKKYGAQAAADAPPVARIREMGIPLACGTDGNRATSYNPWIGLHWLITGKTLGGAKLQGDKNLLDRTEALRLYTTGGAWVSGEEGKKGTLEVGKFADLAILSADYFGVSEDRIKDIESLLTVVGGKVVYGAGPYSRLSPPLPPVSQEWLPVREYGEYYKRGLEDAQNLARSLSRPQLIADGGWGEACGCGAIRARLSRTSPIRTSRRRRTPPECRGRETFHCS